MLKTRGLVSILRSGLVALVGALALSLGFADAAFAQTSGQTWPNRQITLIVPYAAGGGLDFVARLIADDLTKRLNWTVVVENRGGANGMIGSELVAKPEFRHVLHA